MRITEGIAGVQRLHRRVVELDVTHRQDLLRTPGGEQPVGVDGDLGIARLHAEDHVEEA